ncbi:MAG: hypothetical protein RIB84_02930 [Sneathiellaceae bacterium]
MRAMTLLAFATVALTNGSRFGARRAGWGMAGAVVWDLLLAGAVALGLGALLLQFIDPAAAQPPQCLALALAFAGLDLAVMAVYAQLGTRAARLPKQAGALWLDRVCRGVFPALAGSLTRYRRAGA